MAELELDKLILHFAQSNKAEGKSPKTIGWYTEMLTGFARFLTVSGKSPVLEEFNVVSVREFVIHEQERKISPYSVQGKVRALKAFASWLFNAVLYTTLKCVTSPLLLYVSRDRIKA